MPRTGGLWRERMVASNAQADSHWAFALLFASLLGVLSVSLPTPTLAATLNPIADAHVRAGTNASVNFGTANPIVVRTNATVGNNFDGYLKFDLTSINNIVSARLSVLAALSAAGSITTTVYGVSDTAWGETSITWNNRPPLGSALGTVTVPSTTFTRYELDITNYIRAEKAAGRNLVTLGLHNTANTTQQLNIRPREAVVANRPQLIVVENAVPTTSITAPTNGATFAAPANITITANAADTDGTITKVEFFDATTKLGEDLTSPYTFDWINVPSGGHTLTARATDSFGTVTTSSVVNITVTNAPPTVNLVTPINNAVFAAPANITLTADATDTDGTVALVEFFNGTTKLGEDTTNPYTFDWANVTAGTYGITAKVTDNAGAVSTSAPINVSVNALPINYSYDELGRLIRVIDGNGRSAIYEYDATGNRIKVTPSDIANTVPTISSVTPDFIRLGTPRNVTITGTNLASAKINTGDPNLTATIVAAGANEITVRLAASTGATTGPRTINVANTAGSADAAITLRPELTITTVPSFIVVPPDSVVRQLILRLSDTEPGPVTLALAASRGAVSVSPSSVVLNSGQTEATITITGRQTGHTFINVSSPLLGRTAKVDVYVSDDALNRSEPLGVWFPPPSAGPGPVFASSTDLGVFVQTSSSYRNVNNLAGSNLGVFVNTSAAYYNINNLAGSNLGVFVQQQPSENVNNLVGADLGIWLTPSSTTHTINNLTSVLAGVVFGPPEISSLIPTAGSRGANFTLSINGTNFFDASGIIAEPPEGILFTSTPLVASDGMRLTVGISVESTAPLGARVLRVVTPRGVTTSAGTTSNTFTISSP